MPIILAIEPDRRQRDALTGVVRQRVGAELILADTTERALEAIGNRVPDLVLVPALLSPQDDAALAAALRVIAAAAHVRTLTIPVLAASNEAAPSSGLLSRWRRGRSASPAPDGCDPAVFAEQILSYLKESAAERALRVDDDEDDVPVGEPEYAQEFGLDDGPAVAIAHVQADAEAYVPADTHVYDTEVPPSSHEPLPAYGHDPVEVYSVDRVLAAPDYQQPEDNAYLRDLVGTGENIGAAQPDAPLYIEDGAHEQVFALAESDERDTEHADGDGLLALQLNQEEDIDLSDELAGLESEGPEGSVGATSDTELFDGEPVGVYTMPFVIDEPDIDVADVAAAKAFAEFDAAVEPVSAAEAVAQSEFEADAEVDEELFTGSFGEPAIEAEPDTGAALEADAAIACAFDAEPIAGALLLDDTNPEDAEPEPADAEPWVSAFLSPRWHWPVMEGVPTEAPVAFVQVDAAVAEARHAPAPAAHKRDRPEWSELVASLRKDIERRRVEPPQEKPKPSLPVPAPRRSRQPKPVQDEWGFFDPEQCGFAALLAKLDEITEGAEDTPVQPSPLHQSS